MSLRKFTSITALILITALDDLCALRLRCSGG